MQPERKKSQAALKILERRIPGFFLYAAALPLASVICWRVPYRPGPMFTGTCASRQSGIEKVGRVCSKSLIEDTLYL
jgi:hypothetical protein